MPQHTRSFCLEFFRPGAQRDSVHSRNQEFPGPAAGRRASWPASNTWTSATCGRWATPPSRTAAHCPRWCCWATSSGRMRTRWGRAASQVVHLANGRGGEGFVAVSEEGASHLLAGSGQDRGHRAPYQRLQDQRGRGDPAGQTGRVYGRHRAHQTSNARPPTSCGCWTSCSPTWARHFSLGHSADPDFDRLSRGELLGDRVERARLELIERVRHRWTLLMELIDAPADAAIGQLAEPDAPDARRAHAPGRAPVRVVAGPFDPHLVEDRGAGSTGAPVRRQRLCAAAGCLRSNPRARCSRVGW